MPIVGNHDYGGSPSDLSSRDTSTWNTYLGTSYFSGQSWFGEAYNNSTENYWVKFDVGTHKYLVLALELFPRTTVLTWAQGVLNANSDREVIVATHGYLNHDGTRTLHAGAAGPDTYHLNTDNDGQQIWNNFIKANSNIILVVSGHQEGTPTSSYSKDVGMSGNIVNQLFVDHQSEANGGNGYMELLKFRPSLGKIEATSYSASLDSFDSTGAYTMAYENPSFDSAVSSRYSIMSNDEIRGASFSTDGNLTVAGTVNMIRSSDYSSRLYIDSTGNIGIGTTTSLSRLGVNGGVSIGSFASNVAAPSNSLIVSGSISAGTTTAPVKLNVYGSSGNVDANIGSRDGASSGRALVLRYNLTDDYAAISGYDYSTYTWRNLVLNYGSGTGSVGNVGIGTTSPQKKLWVANDGTTAQMALEGTGAAANQHYWGLSAASTGSFSINSLTDTLASTIRLIISPTGNVGIGTTTSPGALLDVVGSSATPTIRVKFGAYDGNAQFVTDRSNSTHNAAVVFRNNGVTDWNMGMLSATYSTNSSDFMITGSSTQRFVITAAGNVGMGQTVPGSALSVSGGISAGTYSATAAPSGGMIISGNVGIGTTSPVFDASGNRYLAVSGESIGVGVAGELGLGSNATNVSATLGGLAFYNAALSTTDKRNALIKSTNDGATNSGNLSFFTSNAGSLGEVMRISSTGNVGIGTTSPYALLSISNSVSTPANTPLFVIASTTNGTATTTVLSVANTGNLTVTGSAATCTLGNSTGSVTCTSDQRLKTNITKIPNALEGIEQINGITFNWSDPTKSQATYIGVIAQDVQKVFPQAVVTLDSGYLAVDYGALVAPLIEAVKELAHRVDALAATVTGFAQSFTSQNGHFTNQLCVGDVCVTPAQFKAMVEKSGQSPIIITDVPATSVPETPVPDATVEPVSDEVVPAEDATVETPPEAVPDAAEAPAVEPAPAQ